MWINVKHSIMENNHDTAGGTERSITVHQGQTGATKECILWKRNASCSKTIILYVTRRRRRIEIALSSSEIHSLYRR